MNQRQIAFAEYYIQTQNASEAARRAGYSPKTAGQMGDENLKKPEISAYIAARLKPKEEKLIADSNEIMQFFTDAMRGKIKDQFGLDASLSDRMTAANSLQKIHDAGRSRNTDEIDESLARALEAAAGVKVNGDVPI